MAGADVPAGAGDSDCGTGAPARRRCAAAPQPAQHCSAAAAALPAAAAEPPPAVETVQADTAERTITVDNGVVRAVFSNRGATLTAWELLTYWGRTASRSISCRTTFPRISRSRFH